MSLVLHEIFLQCQECKKRWSIFSEQKHSWSKNKVYCESCGYGAEHKRRVWISPNVCWVFPTSEFHSFEPYKDVFLEDEEYAMLDVFRKGHPEYSKKSDEELISYLLGLGKKEQEREDFAHLASIRKKISSEGIE